MGQVAGERWNSGLCDESPITFSHCLSPYFEPCARLLDRVLSFQSFPSFISPSHHVLLKQGPRIHDGSVVLSSNEAAPSVGVQACGDVMIGQHGLHGRSVHEAIPHICGAKAIPTSCFIIT